MKKCFAILVTLCVAGFGYLLVFAFTFDFSVPEVETIVPTERRHLDEEIAEHERRVQANKEYLDQLLREHEELEMIQMDSDMVELQCTESSEPTTEEVEITSVYSVESGIEHVEECESETTFIEPETFVTSEPETAVLETVLPETTSAISHYVPVNSLMSPDLQEWTYNYCKSAGVDPFIVMAICERESCCIANIYGDNGRAYGMMQIQVRWVQDKLYAHGYTNEDMLYAQNNIVIGVEILKDHINTGNGMWWAVMAYNGGPQMAGSPATQEYASWVFARAEELRGCPL